MTIYAGGRVVLGGFVTQRAICLTGWHSAAFGAAVIAVFAGAGWLIGALIGFLTRGPDR